jgi:hypothetical protein
MSEKSKVSLFEPNLKNIYLMMSFKGDFDIHDLKKRHPEMYKEITGESNAKEKSL